MAKLIYSAITSLDGYIADKKGEFDWAVPDEEVHAFINDLERSVGTYLYGRRMYEVMVGWETAETFVDQRPVMRDFAALWKAAEKIVYSRTLQQTASTKTRIESNLDPRSVRKIKAEANHNITVGGPNLAAQMIRAGLVDECQLFLSPIVVGGGTQALPDNLRVLLELLDVRRFESGVVFTRYRIRS